MPASAASRKTADSTTGTGPLTGSRAYTLTVGSPTLTLTPSSTAGLTAIAGSGYNSQTFTASGGISPYTYALTVNSGTMPAGMSLNSTTGVLSGTPTALGSSTFTIRATDGSTGTGAPYSGTRGYTLTVGQTIGNAPPMAATTTSTTPVTLHPTANATGGPFSAVVYQHDVNGQSNAGLAYADLASAGPADYVVGSPYGRDRMQVGLGTKFRTGPLTFGLDYSVMVGMGGLRQGVRLTFAAPF